jgi:dihydropteroate synthase
VTRQAVLADVSFGSGLPVGVIGVLNVSPESFHVGSVHAAPDDLLATALAMVEAGAIVIDIGARSTAPYLDTDIPDEEERARLARAIDALAPKLPVPISADTSRPGPARAALDAGARIINDVSGLRDPTLASLVAARSAGVILMASPEPSPGGLAAPRGAVGVEGTRSRDAASDAASPDGAQPPRGSARVPRGRLDPHRALRRREPLRGADDPVAIVSTLLEAALKRARAVGVPDERIVLDPGIGFFRNAGMAWDEWDARVLAGLGTLAEIGRPLCVGVSRKSFIGEIIGRAGTENRLAGSLAATALAVSNGASLIRTHDVAETIDAVRVAERVRRASAAL